MDELGKWFMEVFTSVNKGGRLGPPTASDKRVRDLLEEIGGEGVFKMAMLLNVGSAEAVRQLASCRPDLGECLGDKEPQKALDAYFEERTYIFEPYRKFVTRGLSLLTGNTGASFASPSDSSSAGNEAWEKVFQLLVGRENDDKKSSDL